MVHAPTRERETNSGSPTAVSVGGRDISDASAFIEQESSQRNIGGSSSAETEDSSTEPETSSTEDAPEATTGNTEGSGESVESLSADGALKKLTLKKLTLKKLILKKLTLKKLTLKKLTLKTVKAEN